MASSHAPLRSSLIPHHAQGSRTRVLKRIIVCCDGTWEDGLTVQDRYMYTNILVSARASCVRLILPDISHRCLAPFQSN
jgi:hypothetical protein